MGRYYSLYPGKVRDNADPEGLGRIRADVPTVSNHTLMWAEPLGWCLGTEQGFSWLPVVDANVRVGFFGGSVSHPYYMPGPWSKDQKPSVSPVADTKRIIETEKVIMTYDDAAETFSVTMKETDQTMTLTAAGVAQLLGGLVELGSGGLAATAGVVTGECNCAWNGAPHPVFSAAVLAKK